MTPMCHAVFMWASANVANKVHNELKDIEINNELIEYCEQDG